MGYCWTWNYIESGSFLFLTLKDKIITFIICGTIFIGMLSIIALVSAVIIYLISMIALKVFTKEDINMLPYGKKIYNFLTKIGIYS